MCHICDDWVRDNLVHLQHLRVLELIGCGGGGGGGGRMVLRQPPLRDLQSRSQLEELAVEGVTSECIIDAISRFPKLTRLILFDCGNLNKMDLSNNLDLTEIRFTTCEFEDVWIPSILKLLPHLRTLEISNCHSLKMPIIKSDSLEELTLSECPNLCDPLIVCRRLRYLDLRFTGITDAFFESSDTFNQVPALVHLDASNCLNLKCPRVRCPPSLEVLLLNACDNMVRPNIECSPKMKLLGLKSSKWIPYSVAKNQPPHNTGFRIDR